MIGLSALLLLASPEPAPEPDSDDATQAANDVNNPLNDKIGVDVQNYFTPISYRDPDVLHNTTELRVTTPVWRVLPRLSLPIVTERDPNGDSQSGTGDLELLVPFLLTQPDARFQAGLGPLYVAPTASFEAAGEGKHQLGAVLILVGQNNRLLGGSSTIYQAAVAGDPDRPFVQSLSQQWFLIVHLGQGWYLRSNPTWEFDLQTGDFAMPLGLGAGKAVPFERVIINVFFEPQATIAMYSSGSSSNSDAPTPALQLFMGFNLQLR
jgi:hypothetical protein